MFQQSVIALIIVFIFRTAYGDSNETIWASTIYSYYGDRTPLILPVQNMLTPLGAQQLFSAGSFFRQRYLAEPQAQREADLSIAGLSQTALDNAQTMILSTPDQYAIGSAQAFLQGLYPPLGSSSGSTTDQTANLTNGSVIESPLGGYQYPQIWSFSYADINSIYIAGNVKCNLHDTAELEYANTQQSLQLKSASQNFYSGLQASVLNGIFPHSRTNYDWAYYIFDYLSYGYIHNETIRKALSDTDLANARSLADQWVQATSGNNSHSNSANGYSIHTIAGQTLATYIRALFKASIAEQGKLYKFNLLFGSFEPIVAFAALSQLSEKSSDFKSLPDLGSSMVFEMYSLSKNSTTSFPGTKDLYVRFMFRNGTDPSAPLIMYSLFGGNDTQRLSLADFLRKMGTIMLPMDDWCGTCQSDSVFCSLLDSSSNSNDGTDPRSTKKFMKPAVAGVIGALLGLFIGGIALAAIMLISGIRFHRSKAKRRAELGGFKAGEKLASDPDLPQSQNNAGATVVKNNEGRIGSWELKERSDAKEIHSMDRRSREFSRKPSYEVDEIEPHHSMEPTKIAERV